MMKLSEFRSFFSHPFPRSQKSVGYGIDAKTFAATTGARGHFAHDLALGWPENQTPLDYHVLAPMNVAKTCFYPIPPDGDLKGLTVLDLVNSDDSVRWRFMHLYPGEMMPAAKAKILPNSLQPVSAFAWGGGLKRGEPIAPAGDAGISLAAPAGQKPAPGASARHLHYALLLAPGVYDDVLDESFGDAWRKDMIPDWGAAHKGLFKRLKAQGWVWANDCAAARKDPYTGRLLYAVNAARLMEW